MFRCSEVAERASLLIDNELSFLPSLNIKLHLAMCRGCRAFIAQMRMTRDLAAMAGATHDPVPGENIKAALARRQMRSDRKT